MSFVMPNRYVHHFYYLTVILIASIVLGVALNMFLLPHEILTGGVHGLAMVLGLLTPLNTGIYILLLNIPILILGYRKLGKTFIAYSVFSVLVTSIAMQYIPVMHLTEDALLSSIFGGVITGIGIGFIVRFSGSSGGFDVIGLILTRKRDLPLGVMIFAMNGVVVLLSGFVFAWDLALYTMASIYVTGIVIDRIHTRHLKLTLMVTTSKGEKLRTALLSSLQRGMTVINGQGAYTKERREILYTVISRHELAHVKPLIREIDPHAFVSISETLQVLGNFRRD